MRFRVPHDILLAYNKERVYAVTLAETRNKRYITLEEIHAYFDLTTPQLVEIRDALIAEGKIEEV